MRRAAAVLDLLVQTITTIKNTGGEHIGPTLLGFLLSFGFRGLTLLINLFFRRVKKREKKIEVSESKVSQGPLIRALAI